MLFPPTNNIFQWKNNRETISNLETICKIFQLFRQICKFILIYSIKIPNICKEYASSKDIH